MLEVKHIVPHPYVSAARYAYAPSSWADALPKILARRFAELLMVEWSAIANGLANFYGTCLIF
jgi:hypothetical protein